MYVCKFTWKMNAFVWFVMFSMEFCTFVSFCSGDSSSDEILLDPPADQLAVNPGDNVTLVCRGKEPVKWHYLITPETFYRTRIQNLSLPHTDHPYQSMLTMLSVDEHFERQYSCHFVENKNISKSIYVAVNVVGVLYTKVDPYLEREADYVLAPCKPKSSDIHVKMYSKHGEELAYERYDESAGFYLNKEIDLTAVVCVFSKNGIVQNLTLEYQLMEPINLHPSSKNGEPIYAITGDTISFRCSHDMSDSSRIQPYRIEWILPDGSVSSAAESISDESDCNDEYDDEDAAVVVICKTFISLSKSDRGTYACRASYVKGNTEYKRTNLIVLDPPETFIMNRTSIPSNRDVKLHSDLTMEFDVEAFPDVEFLVLKDGNLISNKSLSLKNEKDVTEIGYNEKKVYDMFFKRKMSTIEDGGNYTIIMRNEFNKTLSFSTIARILAKPQVTMFLEKYYNVNENYVNVVCKAEGHPLDNVYLEFYPDCDDGKCAVKELPTEDKEEKFGTVKIIEATVDTSYSGNLSCIAKTRKRGGKSVNFRQPFVISDVVNSFGIVNDTRDMEIIEDDHLSLLCKANKYLFKFDDMKWYKDGAAIDSWDILRLIEGRYSHELTLDILSVSEQDAGMYECKVGNQSESVQVSVRAKMDSQLIGTNLPSVSDQLYINTKQTFFCTATGVPIPKINWYKDSELLSPNDHVDIQTHEYSGNSVNSTLFIFDMAETDSGRYTCEIDGDAEKMVSSASISVLQYEKVAWYWYLLLAILGLLLLSTIIYLLFKVRKERRRRKKLEEAGLSHFSTGCMNELDTTQLLGGQANKLPYDDSYEFPRQDLKLGVILGQGAFGVVYKGEAKGIINAEEWTPVAVKMVKQYASFDAIKALTMELKILIHIGKHINIVNLLGACTKRLHNMELLMIVEYCEYGNLRDYLKKRRNVFIDLWNCQGDTNNGFDNRAFHNSISCQTTNSAYMAGDSNATSTYLLTSDHAGTDPKDKPRAVSQLSDYTDRATFSAPRPVSTTQLLQWSYQVANGMEYLYSRKVVHGDLAARNVLLAADDIVKICDFGLSRQTAQDDIYKKEKLEKVPLKWMALESLLEGIYSTQSDVWSYGIFLWEIFSLGETPYPTIKESDILIDKLKNNVRPERPKYSNEHVYDIMRVCWQKEPKERPSFSTLSKAFQNLIDEEEQKRLKDLNDIFEEKNQKNYPGEDYLSKMPTPDIDNVMPNVYSNVYRPHKPATQIDEEGYVSSPFIRNSQNDESKFSFSPSRINKVKENCEDMELKPMLGDEQKITIEFRDDNKTLPEQNVKSTRSNDSGFYNQSDAVSNPTYSAIPPSTHSYQNIKQEHKY